MNCEKVRYSPKLVDTAVFDATNASRLQAGSNASLTGLALMAIVNAVSDDTTHDFLYPAVKVLMDPASATVAAQIEKAKKTASAN